MAAERDDLDTGISYRASTPILQKLLNKVKARKRAAGEVTSDRNGMIMNYRALSSRLDDLIEFQGDPRKRNEQGEFRPQGEGAPDPNAMYQTYRVAPAQPGMAPNKESFGGASPAQIAGVAALGGAAGTLGSETVKGGGKALAKVISKLRKRK